MELLIMVSTAVAFLLNSRLGALLLLLAAAYIMLTTKGNLYNRILQLIVYSVPYYTFSIFGGRQRLSLCIIAVALLCVLLTLNLLRRGARVGAGSAWKLILLLIFLGGYVLSIMDSYAKKEAVFVTYHLVVLAYLIFIIPIANTEELKYVNTDSLMQLYIKGACAVALTLFIQYAFHVVLGIALGEVYTYNSDRVIYNVYFYSKSVLSLYLAVGMMYFFEEYVSKKRLKALVWLGIFAGAILINNSRTGLGCFAVCAAVYIIRNVKKIVSSIRVTVMLILVGVVGLYIVQMMLESRASLEGFTDDNGRFETIAEAFRLLPKHIFAGIGGSALDYTLSSMGVSVHNFFVAYLIQFGLFSGLAVNLLLIAPVFDGNNKFWYYLLCVVLGGMLFANWHNVLYVVPPYLLALMEDREQSRKISYYRRGS